MFDENLMKLSGMRGVLGALVVLALLQAGAIAGQAWGLSAAICALWNGALLQESIPDLVLFATCFALLQLVRFAQDTMLDRTACKQAQELRAQLLSAVFDESSLLSRHVGLGELASTATDGIDNVETYLRIIPPKIIGIAAISLPLLVFVFYIDWVSGIILAIMFPVIVFYMILLGKQAREHSERQYDVYTRLTNRFMDTLRGLPVLKAFGATDVEESNVYTNSESVRKATMRTLRTATLSGAVLDLCATFGVAAVSLMLAFRLMDGSIGLFTGLVALMLSPEYFTPIRSFASDYHASLDGKNALSAVLRLLETPAASPADQTNDSRHERETNEPGSITWNGESTLELRSVSYSYGDSEAGIGPISCTLAGCRNVGVIGSSGAGKSTLASIVAGLIEPTAGTVLLNGQAVNLTSRSWRSQVRYIPQNPYVFRATLADNMRFYNPAASNCEIERAVSAVGLDDLVADLPQGLDTLVGEGARGLSGGEAHRVALARILLDDHARILVFDEPTAHLDIETERDLKQPMLKLMEGKLVLFATHRLHWLEDMDDVIELEQGLVRDNRAGYDESSEQEVVS